MYLELTKVIISLEKGGTCMPSFTTHCLEGDVTVERTGSDYLKDIINRNHAVFLNGCQGPDLFMYYHILPLKSQKEAPTVRGYSTIFHHGRVNETFSCFLKQILSSKDEEQIAYVAGVLCHHSMDSIAHPYIFYQTGSLTKDVGYAHEYFESQLDYATLKMMNLTIKEYDAVKKSKLKKSSISNVAKLWNECFRELLPETNEKVETFEDCLTDMHFIINVLDNRSGNKIKIVKPLEKWAKMEGRGTSMIIPTEYDDKLDAFNCRKEVWYHPSTNAPSNETFEDLFNRAVVETELKFVALDNYLNNNAPIDEVLDLVGDRGYDTGVANGELLYFKADKK